MKTKECVGCRSRRMIKFFKEDKRTIDGYSKICNKCKDQDNEMTTYQGEPCTWKEWKRFVGEDAEEEREQQELYDFYADENDWED